MASRASGTPPESSVRLGDLATNLSSLTLTPVTTAPSSRPQRGSRIKGHGKPRKLFSTRESTTHDSAADGSRQPWGLEEVRSLVGSVLLYSKGCSWP